MSGDLRAAVEGRMEAWAGSVRRLVAAAPTSVVMDETGVTGGHSTPPERAAIREAAVATVDRWLERDRADIAALIPEGAVLVTEETLAAGLGDWVRVRKETCDEPSPCDHDRAVAAVILHHLREGT